jgi:hypothetical protein
VEARHALSVRTERDLDIRGGVRKRVDVGAGSRRALVNRWRRGGFRTEVRMAATARLLTLPDMINRLIPRARLALGTPDTVVYPAASATTAAQLSAAGTDVTFKQYLDVDHSGVLAAALPDLLAWAADRLVAS